MFANIDKHRLAVDDLIKIQGLIPLKNLRLKKISIPMIKDGKDDY